MTANSQAALQAIFDDVAGRPDRMTATEFSVLWDRLGLPELPRFDTDVKRYVRKNMTPTLCYGDRPQAPPASNDHHLCPVTFASAEQFRCQCIRFSMWSLSLTRLEPVLTHAGHVRTEHLPLWT